MIFFSCNKNSFLTARKKYCAKKNNIVPRKKNCVKKKILGQEKKTVLSLYQEEFSWRPQTFL